ncbi:MAG TPA: hypothetical protein VNR61_12565 [Niallia sp.]|nr:hypothetical protein [Niallia sp.]
MIIIIILLFLILVTLISLEIKHKKQIENQERIINRLDLLWKEINHNKNID